MSFTFRTDFDSYLTHKRPRLSPDVRRLIDEAVAAGRVTKVPAGVSGIPLPVWNAERGELAEVDPKTAVEKHREAKDRTIKVVAMLKAEAAKRREQIVALAAEGMGVVKIAAVTGFDRKTVSKHLAAARAEAADVNTARRAQRSADIADEGVAA